MSNNKQPECRIVQTGCDVAACLLVRWLFLAVAVLVPLDGASAQSGCDLSGLWRTTLGPMRLAMVAVNGLSNPADVLRRLDIGDPVLEEGLRATVTGTLSGRSGEGWVDGAVFSDRVRLRWYLPESYAPPEDAGEGYLELAGDCDALSGAYRSGFEGDFAQSWSIRRIVPSAADFEDDAAYEAQLTDLERTLTAAARLRDALDETRFDVAARAAALSGDTEEQVTAAALGEMRQIAFVPYPGVLRGARGCLLAESGNAYDQSLLLAALLQARGIDARLATAELTPAAAEALLADAVATTPPGPAAALDEPLPTDSVQALIGLDESEIAQRIAEVSAGRQALLRDGAAEAARHADAIVAAFPWLGRGLQVDVAAIRSELLEATRRHVWVQARLDGVWQDLDPVFGDRGDPARLGGPVEEVGEISDALHHRVNFIVTIERLEDGALVREQVGGWTVRVADAMRLGAPTFRVRNVPFEVPSVTGMNWGAESAATAAQVMADSMLSEPGAYRPVLMLSTGEIDVGTGFDLSGRLVSDDFQVRLANETREALSEGFGGGAAVIDNLLGGGGGAPPAASEATLAAQWLEIQWQVPGGETRAERRAIFDRIGPAARSDGTYRIRPELEDDRAARMAMIGGFDILVTGGPIHAAWRRALRLDGVQANEAAMRRALDLRFSRVPLSADIAQGLSEWPRWLYRFDPLLREQAALSPPDGRVTLVQGEPHLVALRQSLAVDPSGRLVRGIGVDILNAAMAPLLPADARAAEIAQAQIEYGARLTVVERDIVAMWAAERCPDCVVEVVENAAAVTAAALERGDDLVAFGAGDEAALPPFGASDARHAAASALADGWLLVMPDSPVVLGGDERPAWWRIDPETGETLGMVAGRGGEGYAEYIIVAGMILTANNGVAALAMLDRCIDFDPGPGSHRWNADGSMTWYPPTGPSYSGRGIFNCLGCAVLAFACPYADVECWTSANLWDYPTCASTMGATD